MKKITDKSCGSASGISYAADDANNLSGKDLATRLNGYFTSVISDLSPLDLCMPPFSLPSPAQPPTIFASAVQKSHFALVLLRPWHLTGYPLVSGNSLPQS